MKNMFSVLGVAIILFAIAVAAHASGAGESQVTVFSGVRVFDGNKSIPMATVFVVGSEITEIFTNNQEIDTPANAEVISGEGMSSDQSHVLIFGLGKGNAKTVEVKFLNGVEMVERGSFSNTQLIF